LEFASLFNSAGSAVTVYEAADKIAGALDGEIAALLQKAYERKDVVFKLNAAVGGIDELGADVVLLCVGRRPALAGLGLENIGLYIERGAVVTDEQCKTNIPGVFAAGDINGRSMLAHTAYREAEAAVNTMLGKKDRVDYVNIPQVIYTNPEAAGIGETLTTARAKGMDARETKLPLSYSGRFMAENDRAEGLCKLVWRGETLIGAHMLGNPASEVVSALSAILYNEMDREGIRRLVFPHPSVGEIIKEAALHA
jgi:dihydrolipoamide dehydrogenase